MWKEFKAFCFQGNVLDLAVAVIIGAAFGKIVTALVDSIIMPAIGALMGGVNFSELAVTIGDAHIGYGAFIQAVIDFIIIAFCIFLIVKAASKLQKKQEEEAGPTTEDLLTEIRDIMKEEKK